MLMYCFCCICVFSINNYYKLETEKLGNTINRSVDCLLKAHMHTVKQQNDKNYVTGVMCMSKSIQLRK